MSAADNRYNATHREERRAYSAAYHAVHREERRAYKAKPENRWAHNVNRNYRRLINGRND